jgi:hypothetical protein
MAEGVGRGATVAMSRYAAARRARCGNLCQTLRYSSCRM